MTGNSKRRVLVFIGTYLPGFKGGGPVTSIKNMVDRLSDEIEFRVVAPDRDLFSETAYPDVNIRKWQLLTKEYVFYLPPSVLNFLDVLVILRLTPHDVVYLNSFFSHKYTVPVLILRRLGLIPKRPIVLAVRGEFAPAALNLKTQKKSIYLKWTQRLGLLRGVLFQATNPNEEERIRLILGPNVKTRLGPDLRTHSASPVSKLSMMTPKTTESEEGALKIVFLGRISPMKNVDYALEVLMDVRVPIEFSICGPLEDEYYWARCQHLIDKLPEHIKVEYIGSIFPSEVPEILSRYDLFFLPTRGENFGHVIAEALASGCPVLISDQTPWQDLEVGDCGWSLPLDDRSKFVQVIEDMAEMSMEERFAKSENALRYIQNVEEKSDDVALSLNLFSQ